jgi:hypothetical protein
MNETSEALNGRRVVVTGGTSHQTGELAAACPARPTASARRAWT